MQRTGVLSDFVALGNLGDATGKGGYSVIDFRDAYWNCVITKDCKDPVTAMKLLDLFYKDETITRARHGEKDVDWYYEEGTNAYGTDSYAKCINSQAFFSGNSTWGINPSGFLNYWNYMLVAEQGEGSIAQSARLVKEQWEILDKAEQKKERITKLVYTTEEYKTREEISSTAENYISEQTYLFMSGVKDPNSDADWNEYLKTVKETGRDRLQKIAEDAYARK